MIHGRTFYCKRLAESYVTVKLSVMCMDWFSWWYNHGAHLVSSSTALAFITNISEKHISASANAIQSVKDISIEEKLDVLSWLPNGEQIAGTCHNVGLSHNSVCKICDNAARIKGSVKDLGNIKCKQSEMRSICLCSTTTAVLLEPYQKLWMSLLHFHCIRNKYIHCIEMYIYCIYV